MKVLYDHIGKGYSTGRRTDPEIAANVFQYLDDAVSILNVGAGSGSYEPKGKNLVAVEPSKEMILQRSSEAYPVEKAFAESLPFRDKSFTHAMTVLSMHHWEDLDKAFSEIKRVTTKRFVAVTWNPQSDRYWLTKDYFPEIHDVDQSIFPRLDELTRSFPGIKFHSLPIPSKCMDGFTAAYWARPQAYLDPKVRSGMSTFSKIGGVASGIKKLQRELQSGDWELKYGELTNLQSLDVGYVVAVRDV